MGNRWGINGDSMGIRTPKLGIQQWGDSTAIRFPAASLTEEDKKSFYRIDEFQRKMLKPFAEKDVRPDDYDFLRDRITKRQTRALQVRLRPATSDSDRA